MNQRQTAAIAGPLLVALAVLGMTYAVNDEPPKAQPPGASSGAGADAPRGLGQVGRLTPRARQVAATTSRRPRQPKTVGRVGISLPLGKLDAFIAVTGSTPGELSIYQNWASGQMFDQRAGFVAASKGMALTVTWEPWAPACNCADQPSYSDHSIAAGMHDAYIAAYAQSLKNYVHAGGGMVTIRLAHEMNGKWYPWGVGVNGNTAAEFIAMWRHVATVFRQAGVENVRWEWAPNLRFDGATDMSSEYPGDAYVDRVALSGYNWGVGRYSRWQTFWDLYGPSINAIRTIAPAKPFYIAEIACATSGGNKAEWITDLFTQVKAHPYIQRITWFDQPVTIRDWLVETSPTTIRAWKAGVESLE